MNKEWQPIETAPKDGTSIFATDGKDYFACCWDDCSGVSALKPRYGWATNYDSGCMAYDEESPIAWMPIPPYTDHPRDLA